MAAFPHLFADGTVLPAAGFAADQIIRHIGQFMVCGDPNFADEETVWRSWMPEKQFELQFDGDRRRGYVKEGENRFSQEWDAHYGNPPDPVLL